MYVVVGRGRRFGLVGESIGNVKFILGPGGVVHPLCGFVLQYQHSIPYISIYVLLSSTDEWYIAKLEHIP